MSVSYLNVCAQFLEDLVDLIFEATTQHLIGFIQNKHFDPFWGCTETPCLLANVNHKPKLAVSRSCNTYTGAFCSACRTHVLVCPPLYEGPQPGASVFHYGDWSLQCRHGRLPPCSHPEPELPSGSNKGERKQNSLRSVAQTDRQDLQTTNCRTTVYGDQHSKKELSISRVSPERWYTITSPSLPQTILKAFHLLDQCSHGQRLH